jgi:hypothetical protein
VRGSTCWSNRGRICWGLAPDQMFTDPHKAPVEVPDPDSSGEAVSSGDVVLYERLYSTAQKRASILTLVRSWCRSACRSIAQPLDNRWRSLRLLTRAPAPPAVPRADPSLISATRTTTTLPARSGRSYQVRQWWLRSYSSWRVSHAHTAFTATVSQRRRSGARAGPQARLC